MKKFISEFKAFIQKGNVVDMAVGIIVGAAFTAIVNSLVKDIINPAIGLLTGGIDFNELKVVIKAATETDPEVCIRYGAFISAIINFLIVAFVMFLVIKLINKTKSDLEKVDCKVKATIKKKKGEEEVAPAQEEASPAPAPVIPEEVLLLREIRDSLAKKAPAKKSTKKN